MNYELNVKEGKGRVKIDKKSNVSEMNMSRRQGFNARILPRDFHTNSHPGKMFDAFGKR